MPKDVMIDAQICLHRQRYLFKIINLENSMVVRWLGLSTLTAMDSGLILGVRELRSLKQCSVARKKYK